MFSGAATSTRGDTATFRRGTNVNVAKAQVARGARCEAMMKTFNILEWQLVARGIAAKRGSWIRLAPHAPREIVAGR